MTVYKGKVVPYETLEAEGIDKHNFLDHMRKFCVRIGIPQECVVKVFYGKGLAFSKKLKLTNDSEVWLHQYRKGVEASLAQPDDGERPAVRSSGRKARGKHIRSLEEDESY